MSKYDTLMETWKKQGYDVSYFPTAALAADYLDREIDGKTVSSGGSMTLKELGILDRLAGHNTVLAHVPGAVEPESMTSDVFLCSANGVSETGEIVNIDGTGNRVCGTMYAHDTVYLVVGRNKLAPDLEKALWRARNIAAPKNAQRLHRKTPCAEKADRCYDCDSPERICRALVVLWRKPTGVRKMEIVLVDEDLGY